MIPAAFEYHRPHNVDEAVKLLVDLGDEALVVAGGQSVIPMMKLRLAQPEHIVDLQALDELRGIRIDNGVVTVGAMTTQAQVIASSELTGACPILREASLQIADPQVRSLGTLGGNAANGDPGNDMPAVMQALNATYHLRGPDGAREVAARDFYEAMFFTARDAAEILTAVSFSVPPSPRGFAYEKQKRKVGDYATAGAAVLLEFASGKCARASIALTNVGDTPLYADKASRTLEGTTVGLSDIDAAVDAAESITAPAADGRGPIRFRTKVAGVVVRRAIQRALDTAAQ